MLAAKMLNVALCIARVILPVQRQIADPDRCELDGMNKLDRGKQTKRNRAKPSPSVRVHDQHQNRQCQRHHEKLLAWKGEPANHTMRYFGKRYQGRDQYQQSNKPKKSNAECRQFAPLRIPIFLPEKRKGAGKTSRTPNY